MDVKYPCPVCGWNCEPFGDCPGWPDHNGRIMVCGDFYGDETKTGKSVSGSRCFNATRWICTNLACEWEYLIPNHGRHPKDVEKPDWAFDYFGFDTDDLTNE